MQSSTKRNPYEFLRFLSWLVVSGLLPALLLELKARRRWLHGVALTLFILAIIHWLAKSNNFPVLTVIIRFLAAFLNAGLMIFITHAWIKRLKLTTLIIEPRFTLIFDRLRHSGSSQVAQICKFIGAGLFLRACAKFIFPKSPPVGIVLFSFVVFVGMILVDHLIDFGIVILSDLERDHDEASFDETHS